MKLGKTNFKKTKDQLADGALGLTLCNGSNRTFADPEGSWGGPGIRALVLGFALAEFELTANWGYVFWSCSTLYSRRHGGQGREDEAGVRVNFSFLLLLI